MGGGVTLRVKTLVVQTEGNVSDVVPDGGIRVLQLQGGLPVAEQHLGGCVAGSPTLFKLLNARKAQFLKL